ncbi:MAG: class I SAM-dependent methyltransferase [Anaerolineales bacterium]|jgi:SAM-dependent methyltransferase
MKDFLTPHLQALPYFRGMLRAMEARWYQNLDLPQPILDVGCGDGHFASVAFNQQVDFGIDPDYPSLQEASEFGAYRLLLQSDGAKLPFPDASLGSAISNSVLEHIPHLQAVLNETGRVLPSGAPFAFTVPNPGYSQDLSFPRWLKRMGLGALGEHYRRWFMVMSRTWNLHDEKGWETLLATAGFRIEKTFRYFSPSALAMLEWGHYFGAPTLLPRKLIHRWIVAPWRWNLWLTDRLVRRYYNESPRDDGTYSFYLARKQ